MAKRRKSPIRSMPKPDLSTKARLTEILALNEELRERADLAETNAETLVQKKTEKLRAEVSRLKGLVINDQASLAKDLAHEITIGWSNLIEKQRAEAEKLARSDHEAILKVLAQSGEEAERIYGDLKAAEKSTRDKLGKARKKLAAYLGEGTDVKAELRSLRSKVAEMTEALRVATRDGLVPWWVLAEWKRFNGADSSRRRALAGRMLDKMIAIAVRQEADKVIGTDGEEFIVKGLTAEQVSELNEKVAEWKSAEAVKAESSEG